MGNEEWEVVENQIDEIQQSAINLWDSVLEILTIAQIEFLEKQHYQDLEKLGIL